VVADGPSFSLDDLPPLISHGPPRKLAFDEAVHAIERVLRSALANAELRAEHEPDQVTWRCGDRWAMLQSAGAAIAVALGDPGGLRALEPWPAASDTVTKIAWDIARHLAAGSARATR
jgi:hypothetical protein